MAKRKFRLLKESLTLAAGTIIEEKCEDGTQDFAVLGSDKWGKRNDGYIERSTVIKQPNFFEEIFTVDVPKKHLLKVKAFIKKLK